MSICLKLNVLGTIALIWLFFNPCLAQYWCPGSNIPAVCCSKLLNGEITYEFAKFETRFLRPIYGYQDVEIDEEDIDITDCFNKCKVCKLCRVLK